MLDLLKEKGFQLANDVQLTPLTGGVSCDIHLVESGADTFVVKRALAKLKVKQDWYANTNRNCYEQRYLQYVGEHLPEIVPKVIAAYEHDNFFVMEFLSGDFRDWKKWLLERQVDNKIAALIGKSLAQIHALSWDDPKARALFDSDVNFHELRLSPYFEAMFERHPQLKLVLKDLCDSIAKNKQCLVHGDFSPKNILVDGQQIKIVDCEVAWYGDPAFDIAFMLHHLLLKSYAFKDASFIEAARVFYQSYVDQLGQKKLATISPSHLCLITQMLMLARIDGKSPVEYLDPQSTNLLRQNILQMLSEKVSDITIIFDWASHQISSN
ncbi:aminoglycoside phosphotransferase family protein [Alginatibacterium sediminis]|uniref:Aminoglycoside phosphotransferase family protein n=1 Tax=Alginatibacterium sediminis TaxID=2164068 RepID=A0A420E6X6_9ALTE|nr:aminoglycoside phosphotransferase family protein [Alginatibacterium sediminis]RKF13704.1 aminoglycoside phosphotransferase family protein [Alginatibacterium sediminis]